ncbi:MAG: hypothetical protein PWQ57_413 [Desulfovibrionales bacterium]|nr:hypothetical protein [Desulfovibrionales bacterium]
MHRPQDGLGRRKLKTLFSKEDFKVSQDQTQPKAKNGQNEEGHVFTPYPGADEKYDNGHRDWRLYNPKKYHDPLWSPDKE